MDRLLFVGLNGVATEVTLTYAIINLTFRVRNVK